MGYGIALTIIGLTGIIVCAVFAFYIPIAMFGVFLGSGTTMLRYELSEQW